MAEMVEQRRFIRHPASIPIEVSTVESNGKLEPSTRDVSRGGLAFRSTQAIDQGALVSIRITITVPPFETQARVVWCQRAKRSFDVGVQFLGDDDAFRARMVEQVCHIHEYRRRVLVEQGRRLTAQEAAAEWIAKKAARFPDDLTRH